MCYFVRQDTTFFFFFFFNGFVLRRSCSYVFYSTCRMLLYFDRTSLSFSLAVQFRVLDASWSFVYFFISFFIFYGYFQSLFQCLLKIRTMQLNMKNEEGVIEQIVFSFSSLFFFCFTSQRKRIVLVRTFEFNDLGRQVIISTSIEVIYCRRYSSGYHGSNESALVVLIVKEKIWYLLALPCCRVTF